ncbi:unnamed protein product [Leptidea sinapis]|uniref:Uncharacterized protein n=1 Tax=Leptidea sinapis TaxID=189913 RepID=A0A5E4QWK5_9NEOP|nr:unnamed protein product [Leptidea sinapis]
MSSESWEELATQRSEWRTAVNTGIENFKRSRLEDLDAKRLIRKTRPKPSYNYTRNSTRNTVCFLGLMDNVPSVQDRIRVGDPIVGRYNPELHRPLLGRQNVRTRLARYTLPPLSFLGCG